MRRNSMLDRYMVYYGRHYDDTVGMLWKLRVLVAANTNLCHGRQYIATQQLITNVQASLNHACV